MELGFGSGTQTIMIPYDNLVGVLLPNSVTISETAETVVSKALEIPIGSKTLRRMVRTGQKVVIVTSDITRPLPSKLVLPPVLDELSAAGVKYEDITIVFALGSHRKHTEAEQRSLVGNTIFDQISCIDGDDSDCVHLGTTSRGTPVDIIRIVAEANFKICLGNIEYHYFAGYSGGAKAIMPGVSTKEAIQSNHRLMVLEKACAGRLEGNPIREDIEEAASICGVDFIVNVVLDEHKKIIYAVAGDVTLAHRKGCAFLDKLYRCELKTKADIVVVSQGGAPKDINLYQTQKALDNAKHAVRDGGIVILVGSCREGFGEMVFERWMTTSPSPQYMVERIGRDFQLGGHKAAAIAMVLAHADIYLVSEMDPALVRDMFMQPFDTAQNALDAAMNALGKNSSVLVMPYGGSTLPFMKHE